MSLIDSNTVTWKEINGVVVILLLSSGEFFELNKVGSHIWKFLVYGNTPDQIIEEMVKLYAAPANKMMTDVNDFIKNLVEKGMLPKTYNLATA